MYRDRSYVAIKSMTDAVKLAMLQTPSHNRNKHLFTLNRVTVCVGFKYTFLAVKIISVAINFCGKNWRPQLYTYTKAKTLFVDTTCDIPLTECENWFLPFHLAVLFLARNSMWLNINSCSFQLHIMLPAQLTPSPVYPALQVHVKECLVLVQYASVWQLCSPVLHLSTNQQVKVSYKNFLDLDVSPVGTNNWYHDLLFKIHSENVGINTPNKKILHLKACSISYGVAGLCGCYTSEIWPLVISISGI